MPRSYPKPHLSQKRAEVALTMLLAGCRDAQLAGFTAAGLAGSYNVSLASAERKLADARKRRAG